MSELFVTKKNHTEKWYQEPWMLLVVGGPVIVVIAAIATFFIAWQGSDNVVTKDYYRQGLNIDKDIRKDAKAVEYKMHGQASVDVSAGLVRIELKTDTNLPESLLMTVSHNTHASEYEEMQKITLNKVNNGLYEGTIKNNPSADILNSKLWHVKLEGIDWRLTGAWQDPTHTTLQLKP